MLFLRSIVIKCIQQSSEWCGTDCGAHGLSPTNKIIPVSFDKAMGLFRYVEWLHRHNHGVCIYRPWDSIVVSATGCVGGWWNCYPYCRTTKLVSSGGGYVINRDLNMVTSCCWLRPHNKQILLTRAYIALSNGQVFKTCAIVIVGESYLTVCLASIKFFIQLYLRNWLFGTEMFEKDETLNYVFVQPTNSYKEYFTNHMLFVPLVNYVLSSSWEKVPNLMEINQFYNNLYKR